MLNSVARGLGITSVVVTVNWLYSTCSKYMLQIHVALCICVFSPQISLGNRAALLAMSTSANDLFVDRVMLPKIPQAHEERETVCE